MHLPQTSRTEPSGGRASTVNKHTVICIREAVTSCSEPPYGPHCAHVTAVPSSGTWEVSRGAEEWISDLSAFGCWSSKRHVIKHVTRAREALIQADLSDRMGDMVLWWGRNLRMLLVGRKANCGTKESKGFSSYALTVSVWQPSAVLHREEGRLQNHSFYVL